MNNLYNSQMYMNNLTTNEAYEVKVRGATRSSFFLLFVLCCLFVCLSFVVCLIQFYPLSSTLDTSDLLWVRKNYILASGRRQKLSSSSQVKKEEKTDLKR